MLRKGQKGSSWRRTGLQDKGDQSHMMKPKLQNIQGLVHEGVCLGKSTRAPESPSLKVRLQPLEDIPRLLRAAASGQRKVTRECTESPKALWSTMWLQDPGCWDRGLAGAGSALSTAKACAARSERNIACFLQSAAAHYSLAVALLSTVAMLRIRVCEDHRASWPMKLQAKDASTKAEAAVGHAELSSHVNKKLTSSIYGFGSCMPPSPIEFKSWPSSGNRQLSCSSPGQQRQPNVELYIFLKRSFQQENIVVQHLLHIKQYIQRRYINTHAHYDIYIYIYVCMYVYMYICICISLYCMSYY